MEYAPTCDEDEVGVQGAPGGDAPLQGGEHAQHRGPGLGHAQAVQVHHALPLLPGQAQALRHLCTPHAAGPLHVKLRDKPKLSANAPYRHLVLHRYLMIEERRMQTARDNHQTKGLIELHQ